MELQLPFNAVISFFLFLSFITLILRQWAMPKTRRKFPPGPWKLPVIGNMHRLAGALPHVALSKLSEQYGKDLMHVQLGEVSAVVVSSPAVAKVFLKTHDHEFAERARILAGDAIFYNRGDLVFSPYGEYWKCMRKVCVAELLGVKTVRSFESIRRDEMRHLLDRVRSSSGRPMNICDEAFIFTSSMLWRAAFGKIFEGTGEFLKVVDEISTLAGGFTMADMFPSWKLLHVLMGEKSRMAKLHYKADEMIGKILTEHRNNIILHGKKGSGESGSEDFVDVLIRLKDSGTLRVPITDDNIKSTILDIFGGAIESSATITVCAIVEMVKNPRVMAKAQAEVRKVFKDKQELEDIEVEQQMPYLNSVVKETLRLHPPGSLLTRECKKETLVLGYTIPPKTKVVINFWAIGRDPKYWEEPQMFKPERFEEENKGMDFIGTHLEYMPFGAGRRVCPGISFGLANVLSPLAHLLNHFDWGVPNGLTHAALEMTEKPGIVTRIKNDIILVATPSSVV